MKWNKPPAMQGGRPTLSREYFIVSEDMRWQICKSGEPPIYALIRMVGKPEIVLTGTLEEMKREADKRG